MTWLRWLVANVAPLTPVFNPRRVSVEITVDRVALEQGFSQSTSAFRCHDNFMTLWKAQPLLLRCEGPFPTDDMYKMLITAQWASWCPVYHIMFDAIFVIESYGMKNT